jgi:hypothetical protein
MVSGSESLEVDAESVEVCSASLLDCSLDESVELLSSLLDELLVA